VNSVAVQLIIRGLVQGVGYRYFCYRAARSLGLTGQVRNNPDGSVSIKAEGDRSLIEEFIKELKIGPSMAHVSEVEVNWGNYIGQFNDFDITM